VTGAPGTIAAPAAAAAIDPAELARRGRAAGIVSPRVDLVAGGAVLSRAALEALGPQLGVLARVLCELPARLGDDLAAAAHVLGWPADEAAVLADFAEPLDPAALMRADLVRHGGRWRLLELNCGSTVGGMTYASLAREVGLAPADGDDVLARWAAWVSARVDGPGAIVEDDGALAAMTPTLERMAAELGERLGAPVPVLGHRALRGDGRTLAHAGGALAWIYRLFDVPDLVRDPAGYAHVRAALAAGRLRCPMGPAYRLPGSKAALAALWTLRDHRALGRDEAAAVEALVPRTARLTPSHRAEALARRDELVLKPADGYGGHGVAVGREHGAAAWQAKVDEALAGPGPWVMQDYAHPETLPLTIARTDGALAEVVARPLWGVYLLDARFAGAMVRARAVTAPGAVINVAQGAAAGPVELVP